MKLVNFKNWRGFVLLPVAVSLIVSGAAYLGVSSAENYEVARAQAHMRHVFSYVTPGLSPAAIPADEVPSSPGDDAVGADRRKVLASSVEHEALFLIRMLRPPAPSRMAEVFTFEGTPYYRLSFVSQVEEQWYWAAVSRRLTALAAQQGVQMVRARKCDGNCTQVFTFFVPLKPREA